MLPAVRPWKRTTGSSGWPAEYANVHSATADLSSKPCSRRCRPANRHRRYELMTHTSGTNQHREQTAADPTKDDLNTPCGLLRLCPLFLLDRIVATLPHLSAFCASMLYLAWWKMGLLRDQLLFALLVLAKATPMVVGPCRYCRYNASGMEDDQPSGLSLSRNHLMYGPGIPPRALKQRHVSSMITGPRTCFTASRHFAVQISSGSPWYSGRSIF